MDSTPSGTDNWLKRAWKREPLGLLTLLAMLCLVILNGLQVYALNKNTRITERAWVTVKITQFMDLTGGKKPSVALIFENTGKSPAIDLTARGQMMFQAIPLQPGVMPLLEGLDRPSVGVLGPGVSFTTSAHVEHILTTDEIESMKNARQFLFAFGELRYLDIFRTRHRTQFCFEPDRPNMTGIARVCSQWNTAD